MLALFLGAGGSGKTYTYIRVIKPLLERFLGPGMVTEAAPSHAAARLLGLSARTMHKHAEAFPGQDWTIGGAQPRDASLSLLKERLKDLQACLSTVFYSGAKKHIRSNFNTREINSRENYRCFGHNSEPCGNFWTILRHKLPIIHPDLPIPSNNLNSNVQPEFLNPMCLHKTEQCSRVLAAERMTELLMRSNTSVAHNASS